MYINRNHFNQAFNILKKDRYFKDEVDKKLISPSETREIVRR